MRLLLAPRPGQLPLPFNPQPGLSLPSPPPASPSLRSELFSNLLSYNLPTLGNRPASPDPAAPCRPPPPSPASSRRPLGPSPGVLEGPIPCGWSGSPWKGRSQGEAGSKAGWGERPLQACRVHVGFERIWFPWAGEPQGFQTIRDEKQPGKMWGSGGGRSKAEPTLNFVEMLGWLVEESRGTREMTQAA